MPRSGWSRGSTRSGCGPDARRALNAAPPSLLSVPTSGRHCRHRRLCRHKPGTSHCDPREQRRPPPAERRPLTTLGAHLRATLSPPTTLSPQAGHITLRPPRTAPPATRRTPPPHHSGCPPPGDTVATDDSVATSRAHHTATPEDGANLSARLARSGHDSQTPTAGGRASLCAHSVSVPTRSADRG